MNPAPRPSARARRRLGSSRIQAWGLVLLILLGTANNAFAVDAQADSSAVIDLSDYEGHWQKVDDESADEARISAIDRALASLSWIVRRMARGILRKSTAPPPKLQFAWDGERLRQRLEGENGPQTRIVLLDGKLRSAKDGHGVPFSSSWAWTGDGLRLRWEQHQATGNNVYRIDDRDHSLVVEHTINVTAISNVDPIVFTSRFVRIDPPPRASLDLDEAGLDSMRPEVD